MNTEALRLMKTSRVAFVRTYHAVNLALFVTGMSVVWLATHKWLALLGTFVASLNFTKTLQPDERNNDE
jgi:energy-converting hydrogenase Eha subunit E